MKLIIIADMQDSTGVGISLPKDLISRIDRERGDIPRSRYMLRLLQKLYLAEGARSLTDNKSNQNSLDSRFGSPQSREYRSA